MFKKCFPVAFAAACLCFAGCSSDDTAPRPSSITSEDTAPSTRANLPTTPTSPIGGTLEIESEGFAVGVSDYSISNPRTIGDTYVVDVSVKTKQGECILGSFFALTTDGDKIEEAESRVPGLTNMLDQSGSLVEGERRAGYVSFDIPPGATVAKIILYHGTINPPVAFWTA